MDRYVFVVHLPTGRTYSLNKQLKLNCDGYGVPDSPPPEECTGKRYKGDFPAARPKWAERIPEADLHVFEAYELLDVRAHQCRA